MFSRVVDMFVSPSSFLQNTTAIGMNSCVCSATRADRLECRSMNHVRYAFSLRARGCSCIAVAFPYEKAKAGGLHQLELYND